MTEINHQGFYTVQVTDNNTGCQSAPLATLVQINRLPEPGMAFSNSPICMGESIQLSVPAVLNASYSWTGPNGFSSNDRAPEITAATADEAGQYSVLVAVGNCSSSLDVEVAVNSLPNVSIMADTTIEEGESLQLYATGGVIYEWSPADYLSSNATPTPIFSGAPVGQYSYEVSIQDAIGCALTETVNVEVTPRTDLLIVDLFTPNEDGINDYWRIDFLQNFEPYTIQVFSRGGLEVFRSTAYNNDWDGTHYKTGQKLPEGTYYYVIQANFKEFTGAVTIKR